MVTRHVTAETTETRIMMLIIWPACKGRETELMRTNFTLVVANYQIIKSNNSATLIQPSCEFFSQTNTVDVSLK